MNTLDQLKTWGSRNAGGHTQHPSDAEEHAEIARRDREDAKQHRQDVLDRLRDQVSTNSAEQHRARIARASDKQVKWIGDLVQQLLDAPQAEYRAIGQTAATYHHGLITKYGCVPAHLASEIIDRLLVHTKAVKAFTQLDAQPEPAPAVHFPTVAPVARLAEIDAPDGRYALVGDDGVTRFYKVGHSQRNGRAYVCVMASDETHLVGWYRGGKEIMEAIAADPQEAGLRFGREIGKCCRCGRTLTDEASRAAGIGPDCANKAWR